MTFIVVAIIILVLIFGFVVVYGAPYLPTMKRQRRIALRMLKLDPGQTLVELGCGDGSLVLEAARKGIRVYGYELNPLLLLVTYLRTFKYRKQIVLTWGNFWNQVWPRTDAIYVFLLDRYMEKLDKKIIQNYPAQNVKLVSYAFKIPGREPIKSRGGVYMYQYDAQAAKTD